MFLIPCPHCGLRDAVEFRHQGESRERPDPRTATPPEWRAYLYEKQNVAGWTRETWYHRAGCRRFISVERDTVSNEIRSVGAPAGAVHPVQPGAEAGATDAESTRP
jgi:sarcosine oxidase subunit delta